MRIATLLVALLIAQGATAQEGVPKPAKTITGIIKRSAIVESVDPATRAVRLIGPDMQRFTITAGPEVRNFDQIKPRDRLTVEYIEQLRIEVQPAGADPAQGAAAEVSRAAAGDKPGIAGTETVRQVFTVKAIDREQNRVTLENSAGASHAIAVQNPDALALVDVGDHVTTQLTRAMSISIEPPPEATGDDMP